MSRVDFTPFTLTPPCVRRYRACLSPIDPSRCGPGGAGYTAGHHLLVFPQSTDSGYAHVFRRILIPQDPLAFRRNWTFFSSLLAGNFCWFAQGRPPAAYPVDQHGYPGDHSGNVYVINSPGVAGDEPDRRPDEGADQPRDRTPVAAEVGKIEHEDGDHADRCPKRPGEENGLQQAGNIQGEGER